jgi:hypothetical protein
MKKGFKALGAYIYAITLIIAVALTCSSITIVATTPLNALDFVVLVLSILLLLYTEIRAFKQITEFAEDMTVHPPYSNSKGVLYIAPVQYVWVLLLIATLILSSALIIFDMYYYMAIALLEHFIMWYILLN